MKRLNKTVAAVLVVAVAAIVVLAIVLSGGSSSAGGSAQAPSYSGATTVQRRDLVSTDTESGTLSYANPQTVYNRLTGTITRLPSAGQVIKPGRALFNIDNEPVLLMDGTTPAYRALKSSDSAGPDILELNRNLVALGFSPVSIVASGRWMLGTSVGVEALQKSEGWNQTGVLTLGQIVFLPGPQLVATVLGTIGSAGSGGGGLGSQILTTNSTQIVVTVDLNASLQSEATLGEAVSVEMPDGSTVGGRVTAVSPVAQTSGSGNSGDSSDGSGGSGSTATVPITITLDKRAKGAGLDQATVSVSFTQKKASNVLSVPVTALVATAGHRYAVQQAVAPYKLIDVTTGLFAAGDVEISGTGLYQGLKVTDSQG